MPSPFGKRSSCIYRRDEVNHEEVRRRMIFFFFFSQIKLEGDVDVEATCMTSSKHYRRGGDGTSNLIKRCINFEIPCICINAYFLFGIIFC